MVSGACARRRASHNSPIEPRGDLKTVERGRGTESANVFPNDPAAETNLGVESVLHATRRIER
jgi:hypothetical protein